uniref:Polycystin cation channel PKD1/PKD2 domain-containing protein n=3 Tax=Hemiselmis andersenii TaxID=464988 RepID=A0A7S0U3P7_HEMAN
MEQAELLRKRTTIRSLKKVVDFKISQGESYKQLFMFALLIFCYGMVVTKLRDTNQAFSIETSLMSLMQEPLEGKHLKMQDVYDYMRHIASVTFKDPVCGDGVCEEPFEFPGFDTVGCVADCGLRKNLTNVFFYPTDPWVPSGQTMEQQPIYQLATRMQAMPDMRFNIFLGTTDSFIWKEDREIKSSEWVEVQVPDDNVTVCLFQRNKLYGKVATPSSLAIMMNLDPLTMLPAPPAETYSYGDLTESIAWSSWVETNMLVDTSQRFYNTSTVRHPALDRGLRYGVAWAFGISAPGEPIRYLAQNGPCMISQEDIEAVSRNEKCLHDNLVWWKEEKCYDSSQWMEKWALTCPTCTTFEIRENSQPGEKVPSVVPSTSPNRPVTPGNNLIGSILISQKRKESVLCSLSSQDLETLGPLYEDQYCLSPDIPASEPFGIDPMFLTTSPLYDGRVFSSAFFYNQSELNPTSGSPFGFFASPYDFPVSDDFPFPNSESGVPIYRAYLDGRMTAEHAQRGVSFLQEGKFLTNQTESLSVEIGTFNPQHRAFAWSKATFTFGTGGLIEAEYLVDSFSMADLEADNVEIVLFFIVCFLCFGMLIAELKEMWGCWKEGKLLSYLTDIWNLLDMATICFVPGSLLLILVDARMFISTLELAERGDLPRVLRNPGAVARVFQTVLEEEMAFLDLRHRIQMYIAQSQDSRAWVAVNVLLLMARFFKMLHFQGRMGLVTRTFANSATDIAHFTIIFAFVVVMYAILAQLMYGTQMPEFRTLGMSMMMLVFTTLTIGIEDYNRMLTMSPHMDYIATIFWLTFMFLSTVVLLNIFLAILVEGYAVVKETATNSETLLEGYTETFTHDLRESQEDFLSHPCTKCLRSKKRTRFVSNKRMEQLLEAWLWHLDTLVDGRPPDETEKKEDGGRVIRLDDGEEMSERVLMMTLLDLIGEAPEKIQSYRRRTWNAMTSAFRSTSSSARVSNDSMSSTDVESQHNQSQNRRFGMGRRSSTSGTAAFWEALREEVGPPGGNPNDEGQAGRASTLKNLLGGIGASAMQLSPEAQKMLGGSRRMAGVAKQVMSRYGERPQDEQHAEEALKVLKAQIMEKQIEQFRRVGAIEKKVEDIDKTMHERMDGMEASLKAIMTKLGV